MFLLPLSWPIPMTAPPSFSEDEIFSILSAESHQPLKQITAMGTSSTRNRTNWQQNLGWKEKWTDRKFLATIRPSTNLSISFVYRNPCKGDWRSHRLGGRAIPRCFGFRLGPRSRVRDRVVLTPEAAAIKKSGWGAVALLLAELTRRKHLQQ